MQRVSTFSACLILVLINLGKAGFVPSISNFDGDYATIPSKLSETGMYSNIDSKQLSEGIIYYEVNSPLWSDADASLKHRYVWVPSGTNISPNDSIGWDYPEGTVVVKNFSLDTLVGDMSNAILIETRLIVKKATRWYYITYEWKLDQSEAFLVDSQRGKDVVFRRWENGRLSHWRWNYPSSGECMRCHQPKVGAIGISGPNMNRQSPLTPDKNQLEDLAEKGLFSLNLLEENPALHKWYGPGDTDGTSEQKARSFLAMNCGYCHSDEFKAGGAHSFSYWTGLEDPDYLDMESFMADGFPKLIVPGRPDSSYILKRLVSRGTFETTNYDQMPPLSTYLIPDRAIKVVSDWVCELGGQPENCNPIAVEPAPSVEQEEFVINPEKWQGAVKNNQLTPIRFHNKSKQHANIKISFSKQQLTFLDLKTKIEEIRLFDLQGNSLSLRELGKGHYFVSNSLAPGVYTLVLNGSAQKLSYLN